MIRAKTKKIMLPVLILRMILGTSVWSQASQPQPFAETSGAESKELAFDVISVRQDKSGSLNMSLMIPPGGFRATGIAVKTLLAM